MEFDCFKLCSIFCFGLLTTFPVSQCLKLVQVTVPTQRLAGQPAQLICKYDLEGEQLYSVKWYKNGREFFRFVPRDRPPTQVFPTDGINVDLSRSDPEQVWLQAVTLQSSGRYKCEVSADAPSFQTITSAVIEMNTIMLPSEGPEIKGAKATYQPGEMVRVNCTSSRSKPAATLAWYVNGHKPDKTHLLTYPPMLDRDGLETSTLGLQFHATERDFIPDGLKLLCTAAISTLYWKDTQTKYSSQEEVPKQRYLESLVAPTSAGISGPLPCSLSLVVLTYFISSGRHFP